MTAEPKPIDSAALEQLIGQIRGVYATRLVLDPAGKIDKVHVVGSPARNPKQIVRDIESILYVSGGVRLDHRKVSLVQIADQLPQVEPVRARLVDVQEEQNGDEQKVVVTLRVGDREVRGVGTSRPSRRLDDLALAAYATVHALNIIVSPRGRFSLERIERVQFSAHAVALTHISMDVDDGAETLLGISVIRDPLHYSAGRAVLDAVNRRIQRLIPSIR